MGSLPNLHELGKENAPTSFKPQAAIGGQGGYVLSEHERNKILHRHNKVGKTRSYGCEPNKIIIDDATLEVRVNINFQNQLIFLSSKTIFFVGLCYRSNIDHSHSSGCGSIIILTLGCFSLVHMDKNGDGAKALTTFYAHTLKLVFTLCSVKYK